MNKKREARFRRARATREHIKRLGVERGMHRLCVTRSMRHIYAQILSPQGGQVLACASTLEKACQGSKATKTEQAKRVGQWIAERAKQAGIEKVAADRSGYRYHGRLAALIQAARDHGLVV